MNPELFNNRIGEFLEFYDGIEKELKGRLANEFEKETIKDIYAIVNENSKEITLPEQIRYNKRLSTLMMTLGALASERVKQANVAFRYKSWRKHSEWTPAKEHLQTKMDKVLVGDIEQEVAKRIFAEELMESHLQGLADWLTTFHKDVNGYKSALQRQIDFNAKDYGLQQKTAQ